MKIMKTKKAMLSSEPLDLQKCRVQEDRYTAVKWTLGPSNMQGAGKSLYSRQVNPWTFKHAGGRQIAIQPSSEPLDLQTCRGQADRYTAVKWTLGPSNMLGVGRMLYSCQVNPWTFKNAGCRKNAIQLSSEPLDLQTCRGQAECYTAVKWTLGPPNMLGVGRSLYNRQVNPCTFKHTGGRQIAIQPSSEPLDLQTCRRQADRYTAVKWTLGPSNMQGAGRMLYSRQVNPWTFKHAGGRLIAIQPSSEPLDLQTCRGQADRYTAIKWTLGPSNIQGAGRMLYSCQVNPWTFKNAGCRKNAIQLSSEPLDLQTCRGQAECYTTGKWTLVPSNMQGAGRMLYSC